MLFFSLSLLISCYSCYCLDDGDSSFSSLGEDIYLLWHNWGESFRVMHPVSRTTVVGLSTVRSVYLEEEDAELGCTSAGEGEREGDTARCIRDSISAKLVHLECVPSQIKTFIKVEQEVMHVLYHMSVLQQGRCRAQ